MSKKKGPILYIVTYYTKCVTTSWTYSIVLQITILLGHTVLLSIVYYRGFNKVQFYRKFVLHFFSENENVLKLMQYRLAIIYETLGIHENAQYISFRENIYNREGKQGYIYSSHILNTSALYNTVQRPSIICTSTLECCTILR